MRTVFADSFYWVALINRKDQWHERVIEVSKSIENAAFITTVEVLGEVLAHFSTSTPGTRIAVARFVRGLFSKSTIEVLPASSQSFQNALDLYEARPDKGYSLTDCISMNVMQGRGLTEILTNDRHFDQEGFTRLF